MIVKNVKRTNKIIDDFLRLFKDTKANKEVIPVVKKLKNFMMSLFC